MVDRDTHCLRESGALTSDAASGGERSALGHIAVGTGTLTRHGSITSRSSRTLRGGTDWNDRRRSTEPSAARAGIE
jgi:hypothetical protein